MKIGYICSDVDVQVFGHEGCSVHVREVINAFAAAGHEVFLVCAWAGKRRDSRLQARVHELRPRRSDALAWERIAAEPIVADCHLERDLGSVLWNAWLQAEGAELLARERPDFLYERYALFGWGGLELARRFDVPLVMELNAPLCDQQAGYKRFTLTDTARRMEREIISGADALVALTGWLERWAVSLGARPERIHVVPDAVSGSLFGGEPSGDAVRRRLGLEGARVVGFVGSFHWWHDVPGLLRAFSRVHREDAAVRLLLVGDGDRRAAIEREAASLGVREAVAFAGKVSHEAVPEHIAAMDVAVVPYKPMKDFFFSPLKLFECMALARPTVASDIGQIAEVVRHGETGWLYPPGDEAALAARLSEVLADPRRAAAVGEAARREVLAEHTWERVVGKVTGIARELIAARPGRAAQTYPRAGADGEDRTTRR